MKFNDPKIREEAKKTLKKELSLSNINQVPEIKKVVISSGIGVHKEDKEAIKKITEEMRIFCGQAPKINLSRKSVSAFKLRLNQPVGLTVTLRGKRMHDFLYKLVSVALPRVRDFKGLKKSSFDGHGNYSIGIREHIIMPEVKYENADNVFGFQVNIFTSTKNDEQALSLLKLLGFPFEREQ